MELPFVKDPHSSPCASMPVVIKEIYSGYHRNQVGSVLLTPPGEHDGGDDDAGAHRPFP